MICICPAITLLPVTAYKLHEDINGIYVMKCKRKQSDFELPNNLITIFRSYPWPFVNSFHTGILELFKKTFKGKGLIRSSTHHEGNFEMIGERNSRQCSGNLLMLPTKVDKHQYFQENIDLTLVLQARIIINDLIQQDIYAGNNNEDSLIDYYRKKLNIKDHLDLCYNSIITQENFHKSIHVDHRSILSTFYTKN